MIAIWSAFLWLAFAGAMVATPSPSPGPGHARAAAQPNPIAADTVIIDKIPMSVSKSGSDPIAVSAGVPLMKMQPVTDMASFETAGYTARRLMIADLQDSLIAAGCLIGKATGHWDDRTRDAMSAFLAQANARLPVAQPHDALFHFVKGHSAVACRRESVESGPPQAGAMDSAAPLGRLPGVMGLGGQSPI